MDGGIAAAAEQHRLANLHSSVDLRAVALALERGLPYATLLLFLFVSTHVAVGSQPVRAVPRGAETRLLGSTGRHARRLPSPAPEAARAQPCRPCVAADSGCSAMAGQRAAALHPRRPCLQGLSILGFLTYVLARLNGVVRAQVALKQGRRAGGRRRGGAAGAAGAGQAAVPRSAHRVVPPWPRPPGGWPALLHSHPAHSLPTGCPVVCCRPAAGRVGCGGAAGGPLAGGPASARRGGEPGAGGRGAALAGGALAGGGDSSRQERRPTAWSRWLCSQVARAAWLTLRSRRPSVLLQFWEVVFAVAVCDTLLRYLAVLAKVWLSRRALLGPCTAARPVV